MLPLYEDSIFILIVLSLGGCAAIFAAKRGKLRLRVYATVFFVALIWPWPVAYILGLDHYTIVFAFYIGVWTATALLIGTVWGLTARQLASQTTALTLAFLPLLAGATFVLERQRVPDAPCAKRALFRIGDLSITVPREMGARSAVSSGAPEQVWDGIYSTWPGSKTDVRAFCIATDGGSNTAQVHHLWFSFSWFRRQNEAACELHAVSEGSRDYCAAIKRTQLTVVQLYARPDQMPYPSLSHFNPDTVVNALTSGERRGYICGEGTDGPSIRYCTIWSQLTPEVLAVSSAKLGPISDDENPVADADIALNALLSSF